MSSEAAIAARRKPAGVFSKVLLLSLAATVVRGIILALLAGIALSILVEWVGMLAGVWSAPGAAHARAILVNELRWTNLLGHFWDPHVALESVRKYSHPILETASGLAIYEYILAMYYVAQTTVVRIIVVICSLPAVLLIWLLALLDGLAQRDLRKYRVLHESSYLYHNAKTLFAGAITFPPILYLALPLSFHPTIFLAFFAGAAGTVIWLMSARFKKYL